jgi:23S rRNA pseudouridine955/2504/2580 synthase
MEFLTNYRITAQYSRMRIDRFLSQRYSYLSRTEWQKEILSGKIAYNGTVLTRHDKRINPGDTIVYAGRDAAEPDIDTNYSIIYEDDYLLGINKPANLPVHPAGIFYHNTLLTLLQKRYPMKLHLLHRLDRETSGVVILAKDPRIASDIHKNFNSVEKKYLALVRGVPDNNEFMVDMPIDFDRSSELEHKRIAHEGARETACTSFISILSFNGMSLLKAVPHTGRQHQIRVHLHHAGYPIVGDKLYGGNDGLFLEFINKGLSDELVHKLGFTRSALHSRSIIFDHPALRKKICIKAPLAEDMRQFIKEKRGTDV